MSLRHIPRNGVDQNVPPKAPGTFPFRVGHHDDLPRPQPVICVLDAVRAIAGHALHRFFPFIHGVSEGYFPPHRRRVRPFQQQNFKARHVKIMGCRRRHLAAAADDDHALHALPHAPLSVVFSFFPLALLIRQNSEASFPITRKNRSSETHHRQPWRRFQSLISFSRCLKRPSTPSSVGR